MQIPLNKQLSNSFQIIKKTQIVSYFCVGGCAAIVEWLVFAVLTNILKINYLTATIMAFIISTAVNWALGRILTFRNSSAYNGKALLEGILIYAVSGVGLGFNLGLMYCFVTLLKMNTSIKKVLAKIIATGIVFLWNYFSRKLVIYRNN